MNLPIDDIYMDKNEFGIMCIETKEYFLYDFRYKNIIIEYNGVKFHAKTADDPNFRNPYKPELTSEEVFSRDERKKLAAIKRGFNICVIWNDITFEENLEICKNFILQNLMK